MLSTKKKRLADNLHKLFKIPLIMCVYVLNFYRISSIIKETIVGVY